MSATAASVSADAVPQREGSPLRFVSAASLFDGHDAAINIIRRLLQQHGAEVVHLGHNRSVAEIVRAAIQENADGIAVSSYQGGHNEYFKYMVDMLREQGAGHIRVVVGGGGTIAPDEIAMLEAHGVEKIYTPDDGLRLGLNGMIDDVFARVRAWPKPAYGNEAIFMLHGTSLAMLVTIVDITGAAKRVYAVHYIPFEAYITAGVFYLTLTLAMVAVFRWAENRFLKPLMPR